jgi:hypothetical protein
VKIDPIRHGTGESSAIARDLARGTGATSRGIARLTAGTWIHGAHEREASREGDGACRACDDDIAIFHRLPERLHHVPPELEELIQEEHSIVRQAHLTRPWRVTAAD